MAAEMHYEGRWASYVGYADAWTGWATATAGVWLLWVRYRTPNRGNCVLIAAGTRRLGKRICCYFTGNIWRLYWSQHAGSNRGPADYKSAALPTELYWQGYINQVRYHTLPPVSVSSGTVWPRLSSLAMPPASTTQTDASRERVSPHGRAERRVSIARGGSCRLWAVENPDQQCRQRQWHEHPRYRRRTAVPKRKIFNVVTSQSQIVQTTG